jgi:hypothetical protein
MATTDVFNNPANNYVNPALSPCAGAGDDSYLQFLPNKSIGIVQGSNILAAISFADLKIPVSGYSTQKKVLGPLEVAFIPGLTKGLNYRSQSFTLPPFTENDLNPYFMIVDLSIGFYRNFRYEAFSVEASANYAENINISDALNIALSDIKAKIVTSYDPSSLTFLGTGIGQDFNVTNVKLTLIDASDNSSSPFPPIIIGVNNIIQDFILDEDLSKMVLYAKYPNSAMQGILLRVEYPSSIVDPERWVYINHVTDIVTIFEPVQVDNFITNIRNTVNISFDPSIVFGPFIGNLSINVPDFSFDGSWVYDPSVIYTVPSHTMIDSSLVEYSYIPECSILSSEIYYSEIVSMGLFPGTSMIDSSVYGSVLYDMVSDGYTPSIIHSFISDSSASEISAINSIIQSSWIDKSWFQDSSLTNNQISDSSIGESDITYSILSNGFIRNSNVLSSLLDGTSIYNSSIKDSSLSSNLLDNVEMESCDISVGYLFESYSKNSYIFNSTIIDSSILESVIDVSSFIMNSTIEYSLVNPYKLWIDPSTFIWVTDDPTLTIDSSLKVKIQNSIVNDSSLNNSLIMDSSIFNSYAMNTSFIRCTLYNVILDSSTTSTQDCKIVQINMVQDCSLSYDLDSSTYYSASIKTIEVGMSGCSMDTAMSAGDYLDWITTNEAWNKVGDLYFWTSAPDAEDTRNLIDGFYVYNPHDYFSIQLEYLLFI